MQTVVAHAETETSREPQRAELTGSLRHRDEIIIEKAPDELDEVQLAGEREIARLTERARMAERNIASRLFEIRPP
jgi:hypothetical protein